MQSVTPSGKTTRSKQNPHKDNPGHGNPHSNPHPGNGKSEPLQPAKVKPAKEKINNGHSKDFESGESHQKKSPASPVKPLRLTTFKEVGNTGGSGGDDSPSDSEYLTPSTEVGGFSLETAPPGGARDLQSPQRHKAGMAFFVDTKAGLTTSTPRSGGGSAAQSFTVEGQGYTEETAKAAGIPVVNSREYRSSSDGSDQELRKIHADHRDTEGKGRSFFVTTNGDFVSRPDSLNISKKGVQGSHVTKSQKDPNPSPKTSFAELSARRGSETSPESPSKSNPQVGLSLKEQFEKARNARSVKKTTFAALPNQTTWQETAKKNAMSPAENRSPEKSNSAGIPSGSELLDVRLRLEERRRQIENEKRKMELQWDRQRQNVSKEAFMKAIHKNKDGSESAGGSSANSKVIPKTIPEHKEISPGSPSHVASSSTRTSQSRASPSRDKVRRSHSERIPASQRSTVHLRKPLASEAEDKLQEIMHKLENIDMTSSRSTKVSDMTASSRSSSMPVAGESHKGSGGNLLLEQDSLTNISKQAEKKQSSPAPSGDKKVKKQFSREDIQNKIDGVRQRWFSDESPGGAKRATSTPPRPVSAQNVKCKSVKIKSKNKSIKLSKVSLSEQSVI